MNTSILDLEPRNLHRLQKCFFPSVPLFVLCLFFIYTFYMHLTVLVQRHCLHALTVSFPNWIFIASLKKKKKKKKKTKPRQAQRKIIYSPLCFQSSGSWEEACAKVGLALGQSSHRTPAWLLCSSDFTHTAPEYTHLYKSLALVPEYSTHCVLTSLQLLQI